MEGPYLIKGFVSATAFFPAQGMRDGTPDPDNWLLGLLILAQVLAKNQINGSEIVGRDRQGGSLPHFLRKPG